MFATLESLSTSGITLFRHNPHRRHPSWTSDLPWTRACSSGASSTWSDDVCENERCVVSAS